AMVRPLSGRRDRLMMLRKPPSRLDLPGEAISPLHLVSVKLRAEGNAAKSRDEMQCCQRFTGRPLAGMVLRLSSLRLRMPALTGISPSGRFGLACTFARVRSAIPSVVVCGRKLDDTFLPLVTLDAPV